MSVHYKFKSALEYDTVTFDGLHISVKDLKNAILQQKRIGKSTDFDLQVTNAQTKEVYEDESALIPKNTSLLIARVPILTPKNKPWEGYGGDNTPPPKLDDGGPIAKAVDLSSLDASEDDKIKAMMSQSTQDYDPSNYMKIRGANQMGTVPPNYRCHKCHQGGHWIKDCTFGQGSEPMEIKKSTGIPRNFLVPVEGPQVPGAMMTPNGQYAVPLLDLQAYNQKSTPSVPMIETKTEIPEDLLCNICTDLLADAVMIPCCGNSFCDECIRGVLLESEDHECPDCHEKDVSPETLIPNRFLRTSVSNFKNTTGYVKKPVYRERIEHKIVEKEVKEATPPPEPESTEKLDLNEKKTVISEADSTEQSKKDDKESSDILKLDLNMDTPPGISPKSSPKDRIDYKDNTIRGISQERITREHLHGRNHGGVREESPRKTARRPRSKSPYNMSPMRKREERSGTPTVDEPTSNIYNPPTSYGNTTIPPIMPHMNTISSAPPSYPPPIGTYPPSQGPPPNYRLPPPGAHSYLAPGAYPPVAPRPMFDQSRPPMTGLPPGFNPNYPPRGHHRDFGRRMRERTPPGVIDDPLAAFNRMLREKDERKRRAKRRSYSRSRSRSRSYSRSPLRRRSRSPRMRRSRSRSRSFSISRSRSRSYSGSPNYRSPLKRRSPLPLQPGRRCVSRYKSPTISNRSPPRPHRHRSPDYDDDYDRYKDKRRGGVERRSRDRDRYYDNYDDRRRQWSNVQQRPPMQDSYYPAPPPGDIPTGYPSNRYPPPPPQPARDYYSQPLPQTIHSIQPQPQRYVQDIHPPGVDDDIAPPGVDDAPVKSPKKEPVKEPPPPQQPLPVAEKEKQQSSRERNSRSRHKKSRTPERKPSKELEKEVEKKKRRESTDDEEKGRKSKDKKKHKERKDKDVDKEKKKKRDKKEKHKKESKEKKSRDDVKVGVKESKEESKVEEKLSPKVEEKVEEVTKVESNKPELYEDVLKEGVDVEVMEKYGKIDAKPDVTTKDNEEEEKDVLELHLTDIELDKPDILAPLPEKSKWEVEDDQFSSPKDQQKDLKLDKNKVTNEVIKRAENAIFAKAINAIRPPIEIKKISTDRVKLYTESEKVTEPPPPVPPARLPVKERLGIKIEEPEKVINLTRHKSRTVSPFSRRGEGGRNVDVDVTKKRETKEKNRRSKSRHRSRERKSEKKIEKTRSKERKTHDSKRKRSKSRSLSKDRDKHRSKKDKRQRNKDKGLKKEDKESKDEGSNKQPMTISKRKPTIDEANFEPDYDLESDDSAKKKIKKRCEDDKSSSSDSDSTSSSEDDKKRKKKKKHRKRKRKESSSSNSSDSESDSSDSERGKRRRKHKKSKKKKKKSRHK